MRASAAAAVAAAALLPPRGAAALRAANATRPDGGGVLFAFAAAGDGGKDLAGWQAWPWDKITHVGFWSLPPADFIANAKAHGVRLYQDAHLPDKKTWTDKSARDAFAQAKLQQVQDGGIDGVFFDYEGNDLSAAQKQAYVDLAQAVTDALRPSGATVFVCVGGSPSYELRSYDYAKLAAASEFLFVMAYDLHFWDDYTCVTKGTCSPAEAPIKTVSDGVNDYVKQVPANKLVLGLPWYGQRYTNIVVPVNKGQIKYRDIVPIAAGKGNGKVKKKVLDKDSMSWDMTCDVDCWGGAKEHQGHTIWFDDAETLKPKYQVAKDNGLLGVGAWEVTDLPTDPTYADEAKAMWDAITSWNQ